MNSVLQERPSDAVHGFLKRCARVRGVDVAAVYETATTTIKYLNASAIKRSTLRLNQTLEVRWYESLASGSPDWSVYDSDLYLGDLWACWIVYSRRYLCSISKPSLPDGRAISDDLGSVRSVADLGCGIAYTSAALAQMFPAARVVATNLPDTTQTEIAKLVCAEHKARLVYELCDVGSPVDLVFASEYFEHIPAPIAHLRDALRLLRPKALLIANTFGTRSIGHFERYDVDGAMLPGAETSKRFNDVLRDEGYEKMRTRLWNNRPAYWKLSKDA